jgi:hypothetical protein
VILSEQKRSWQAAATKKPRMSNLNGINQGKSETCREKEKNRCEHKAKCNIEKIGLSGPTLANEKTRNRRDFPALRRPNVRRRTYCGNRG